MAAPTVPTHVTLDAFYTLDDLPDGAELANGEVVVTPSPSADHSELTAAIHGAMRDHVVPRALGRCYTDGCGYELPISGRPDVYRIPDASFVRAERIPRVRPRGRAYALAPDVAVEVRSPSDRPGVLRAKLADYLEAGTAAVWVIDGDARTVEVHAPGAPVRVLREGETLDGGAVLPGFALALTELFAVLDG